MKKIPTAKIWQQLNEKTKESKQNLSTQALGRNPHHLAHLFSSLFPLPSAELAAAAHLLRCGLGQPIGGPWARKKKPYMWFLKRLKPTQHATPLAPAREVAAPTLLCHLATDASRTAVPRPRGRCLLPPGCHASAQ